jgi:hypothetical protein
MVFRYTRSITFDDCLKHYHGIELFQTSINEYAPLSLIAWWVGTSVPLILYSIALPCLVGFTHLIRTMPRAVRQA